MDIDGAEDSSTKVQVQFFTKLKPPYKAPLTSVAIPTNITRFRLSEIVNDLLAGVDDWHYQPFDFLIDGKLLRMSLEDFLLAKGISAERVIEIEYIKVVAPRREDISLHDDWVSAVDGSQDGYILTGCYDGLGRIWKDAGTCTHVLEGHTGPITSVCVIKPKVESAFNHIVATASKDRSLRLWKIDAGELAQPKKTRSFKILKGHDAAVQSIAAQPSGEMVCSGSWDCAINLWQANGSDAGGDVVSVKRRKKGHRDEEPQFEEAAVSTLVGHTQCISSLVWPQHETIYSASWDQSIRRWDVETGNDSLNMGNMIQSFNCWNIIHGFLLANGTKNHGYLVSASYDGKVMIWDLRIATPLYVIDSHKNKVLCADWWKDDSVISGGVDSKLCISSRISVE